ncbi:MAG TPA: R3H domain-containing nucleic acid-binding protein, partial [Candidatus Saccharimonadales bacterium]|nr:R3H domain-containing nucleic acid-binding protein [Candidatus Saccharimonadales bacterium]
SGIPIHVLRSNTVAQIKGALARVYGVETPDDTEAAMQDVIEGIEQMQRSGDDVELTPQNSYVRRLQHQLVERHELSARSTGDEPNRRLVILRPAE